MCMAIHGHSTACMLRGGKQATAILHAQLCVHFLYKKYFYMYWWIQLVAGILTTGTYNRLLAHMTCWRQPEQATVAACNPQCTVNTFRLTTA